MLAWPLAVRAGGGLLPPPSSAAPPAELQPVSVVGVTAMPGSGIDIDKVPSNVQTLSAQDIERDGETRLLPAAAALQLSSVNLNDEQGSQYQPDFVYRGFEASPISGISQGLAVYQNGTRINEAFGDAVNWDLVAQFAVNRLTLQSNNPVFGLNALGGAATIDMKNGFNAGGADVQVSGGSFGNVSGYGEYGAHRGPVGVYAAVGGLHDDGFRYHSPTRLFQAYADLGYEDARTTLHLSVGGADNDIGATGPTPVQMLRQNPKSVFTYPAIDAQSKWSSSSLRRPTSRRRRSCSAPAPTCAYFLQGADLIDGNTTDVQACGNNAGYFCLEGAGNYPGDALYDSAGDQVAVSVLPAGATPGEIDSTSTNTVGSGGAFAVVTAAGTVVASRQQPGDRRLLRSRRCAAFTAPKANWARCSPASRWMAPASSSTRLDSGTAAAADRRAGCGGTR